MLSALSPYHETAQHQWQSHMAFFATDFFKTYIKFLFLFKPNKRTING